MLHCLAVCNVASNKRGRGKGFSRQYVVTGPVILVVGLRGNQRGMLGLD